MRLYNKLRKNIFLLLFLFFLVSSMFLLFYLKEVEFNFLSKNNEYQQILSERDIEISKLREENLALKEAIEMVHAKNAEIENVAKSISDYVANFEDNINDYEELAKMIGWELDRSEIVYAENIVNIDNVTQISGLTAEEFEHIFDGTGYSGHGKIFEMGEKLFKINGLIVAGIGIAEVGWDLDGNRIAREKNNPFDIGAYNHDPYGNAFSFESIDSSIIYTFGFLRNKYLNTDSPYYNGLRVMDLNKRYAINDDGSTNYEWSANTIGASKTLKKRHLDNVASRIFLDIDEKPANKK